jgi:hypothetical protein
MNGGASVPASRMLLLFWSFESPYIVSYNWHRVIA